MKKITHDYICESCDKPATRLFEMSWVEVQIDKDGGFHGDKIDELVDDTQQFYCDEHEV